MRRSAHLSDDRLIEVWIDRTATAAEDAHLSACDECRARRLRLELMFTEISGAAEAEADAAFPDERLAAQRTRILHRIEQDGRPARVIAFPAAGGPEVRPLRTRPAARWIAAAAAAGLAIGLLAGHLAHDLPTMGRPSRAAVIAPAAAARPATPRPVNAVLNDEEFLGEIEFAIEGPHLAVLQPLHDLTPQ
jgi:anti-sigma factor RsiW